MKILIIRHGEPDYAKDCLTEKGQREAECLAEMLAGQKIKAFYTSPLGRAKDTAAVTLERMGRTAVEMPWLREFDVKLIDKPDDPSRKNIPWDWLPQDWTAEPRFYEKDHWFENERMMAAGISEEYREVTGALDELLAWHGYIRDGRYYRVERANHDTIVLFCHFGVESVILSHLWGVSPVLFWHNSCARTSSVTTLVSEERREGIALFRMVAFGETTHLYVNGEEPSFAARFCECWTDETRHD